MRRQLLFGSRFVLGVVLTLAAGFALVLIAVAPLRVDGGIAWVYLRQADQSFVRISGHELVCQRQPNQDRCSIDIQNRSLVMAVIYKDGTKREMWNYENVRCEATYADRPVACEVNYDYATYNLPILDIKSDLGLSQAQFQAVKHSSPLAHFYDADWLKLSMILSIAAGIFTTTSIGLQRGQINRITAGLGTGLGTAIVILGLAPFLLQQWASPLGMPLVLGGAIGIGLLTAMIAPRQRKLAKVITSFSSGLIVFSLFWITFLMALLSLGYVD